MYDNEATLRYFQKDGEVVLCEVLFTFESAETGKNYVIYTDYAIDAAGGVKVYCSSFLPDTEPAVLQKIESEEEWEMLESILYELMTRDEADMI